MNLDPSSEKEGGRKTPAHPAPVEIPNSPVIIFLTVCTKDRAPILADERTHSLLLEAWTEAERWVVGRYVVMPDHVHLFCAADAEESCPLQEWVNYWKSFVARRWPEPSKKLWQRSFWDTQLRQGESYAAKWDYVVNNPVRAGLIANATSWPFQGELHRLYW